MIINSAIPVYFLHYWYWSSGSQV